MERLVREAVSRGAPAAVVASSGNAAVAAASAACRHSLPLLAVVPSTLPNTSLRSLHVRGAAVVQYGADPGDAYLLARHLASRFDLYELASTFYASGTEYACRDIGHEIIEQLGEVPEAISAAISVGPVLVGCGNGIYERTRRRPALLGGQAAGCAPIAAAFERGDNEVAPWTAPITTTARSIADPLRAYPEEGSFCLRELRASGGFALAWSDEELLDARTRLVRVDGVDIETASAAALLAAEAWSGDKPVVAILTGADRSTSTSGAPAVDINEFADKAGLAELPEVVNAWTSHSPL